MAHAKTVEPNQYPKVMSPVSYLHLQVMVLSRFKGVNLLQQTFTPSSVLFNKWCPWEDSNLQQIRPQRIASANCATWTLMDAPAGFEPAFSDSKSDVLPLDDGAL